jgi:hypothetical protein
MTVSTSAVPCLICSTPLTLRLARRRKSGKPFLMLICPIDGRHFRAFVTDKAYVSAVLARLEGQTPDYEGGGGPDYADAPDRRSRTNLDGLGTNENRPLRQSQYQR